MLPKLTCSPLKARFRGLLPVVIDVETSGLDPTQHALLEIAMVPVVTSERKKFIPLKTMAFQVEPFLGATFDQASLEITGIDPNCALRYAVPEQHALHCLFQRIKQLLEETGCQRAILVGHNAWFDLAFVQAAVKRCYFTDVPLHSFKSFDTATLGGFLLGETVLAKALRVAHLSFDIEKAHSAIYDAEKTAELFCYLLNNYRGGQQGGG